jgi:hypothetical protein
MKITDQFPVPADLLQTKQPSATTVQEAGWVPEPVWALTYREKSLKRKHFI